MAKQRIIAMRLRQDAWKQVKIATVERGTTARYLMIEALNDWFAKHGKPPIA
jgi:Antitoxin-like ribbon-helix-helix